MGLHARYVLLDAQGALPKREKKKVENEKARKERGKAAGRKGSQEVWRGGSGGHGGK